MGLIFLIKKLLLGILPLFFPIALISCSNNKNHNQYITSVHDGDTFTNSNGIKYRLYGVDTPEVSDQYNGFKLTTGIEGEIGEEATQATKDLILHKTIVERVITIDRYGRTVAAISCGGVDLASYLLRNGLARVAYMSLVKSSPYYTRDVYYYKSLLKIQHYAFIHHKGLWSRVDKIKEIFPKA